MSRPGRSAGMAGLCARGCACGRSVWELFERLQLLAAVSAVSAAAAGIADSQGMQEGRCLPGRLLSGQDGRDRWCACGCRQLAMDGCIGAGSPLGSLLCRANRRRPSSFVVC